MPERHGRAIWNGLQGIISCTYTCSHGISPGIAVLTAPEQDISRVKPFGMLMITDGVGKVELPRCKIVDVKFSGGGGSPRLITFYIADRRWMWRFGHISGNWNEIDPYPDPSSLPPDEFVSSGGPYRPGSYRTAEKLLADCLAALNEPNPLIEPAPVFPVTVRWDAEPPASAMQALCDAIGYRIVYQPVFDRVVICPAGVGQNLPALPTIISGSDGIDPPERPNAFQLIGGDTIWNDYLELEPVTLEENGEVVTLDESSYTPTVGWGNCVPPNFSEVRLDHGAKKCALAQQHVWRTFRVKMRDVIRPGATGSIQIPQYGRVFDRKQIVLSPELYGLTKDERGQFRSEPPIVVGSVFHKRAFDVAPPILGPFFNTINERIPVKTTIDPDRGLVMFDKHLFRNAAIDVLGASVPVGAGGAIEPPTIYLFTSFRIRSSAGGVFSKFEAAGQSPVSGDPLCPPEVIRRPELVAVIGVVRNPSKGFRIDNVVDNLDELRPAADYHLNAAGQKHKLTIASERTYAGIVNIAPDGAVQQVTWSVGGGPATTQASRNSEHSQYVPDFPERRRREVTNDFWGRQLFPPRPPETPSPGGGR